MAAYFEGATVDDIYEALAYAETGTHQQAKDDPWTRTYQEGSGSSAYGPVGLTGGGGSDRAIRKKERSMMWNIYHNPKMAKDMKITEEDRVYISRFLEQADRFLDPVSDEEGSTYGYGGSGVLTSDKDKASYKSVAKKLIKYELDRVGGIENWKKFKRNWRDADWDTEYFKKVDRALRRSIDESSKAALFPDETLMESVLP